MMTEAYELNGANLIAGESRAQGSLRFRSQRPGDGTQGDVEFVGATHAEVDEAVKAAAQAFVVYRTWLPARIGDFLRAIAKELEADRERLVATADLETGLGEGRLTGEVARSAGQLRAFADWIEAGRHLAATLNSADPDSTPPRPELKRMRVPIGPVAVFGASNFPFAFSVPGGDTAAALAAGCPVIFKAHSSHPETSELCARAILRAADQADAPRGIFSMIHGDGRDVGQRLVAAADIEAVGFTGSYAGGRAIFDTAARRERPIPVYAEMGSLNPVLVTRHAVERRGGEIAGDFVASMTLGAGQFCTKPGLLFLPTGADGDEFVQVAADELASMAPGVLLNAGIAESLRERLERTTKISGVTAIVSPKPAEGPGVTCAPVLLETDADTLMREPQVLEEHFGPVAVVVRYDEPQLPALVAHLAGNLTVTVHGESDEYESLKELVPALTAKTGRLVWNGFPTGVAVVASQHHGGPYPATTNALHTSVGAYAIDRFLRPISYQGLPKELLPDALQEHNPLGIDRLQDGVWTQ